MNDKEYIKLSEELQKRIMKDRNIDKAPDPAIRRDPTRDKANLWRPAFVRDVEKILHCPYYNRYSDKTQVFTFYKNDDISRRALHVQLVGDGFESARRFNCDDRDRFLVPVDPFTDKIVGGVITDFLENPRHKIRQHHKAGRIHCLVLIICSHFSASFLANDFLIRYGLSFPIQNQVYRTTVETT